MLAADRTIAAAIARVTDRPGAATVALCAPLDVFAAHWLIAWVGDCRVYRWSPRGAGRLELLTRDDTFGHLGETPPPGGSPDDPARMVGNGATTGANVAVHGLGRGELLALCSDGVHKHLDDADWCRVLGAPLPLARRGEALVALARAHGSVDDATVLLLHRPEHGSREPAPAATAAGPPRATGKERAMTPADIDRVFGRGRLHMVTGEHVEVFREAVAARRAAPLHQALPGDRRGRLPRAGPSASGASSRAWSATASRRCPTSSSSIAAPPTGRRSSRPTTPASPSTTGRRSLPLERDGARLRNVFEDCAHWWALARHCLIALDAIHELQLVHLDLKADNVCIPVGPIDFDPRERGQRAARRASTRSR